MLRDNAIRFIAKFVVVIIVLLAPIAVLCGSLADSIRGIGSFQLLTTEIDSVNVIGSCPSVLAIRCDAPLSDPPTHPGLYELKFRIDSTYTVIGKTNDNKDLFTLRVDTIKEWYNHVCHLRGAGISEINGWWNVNQTDSIVLKNGDSGHTVPLW